MLQNLDFQPEFSHHMTASALCNKRFGHHVMWCGPAVREAWYWPGLFTSGDGFWLPNIVEVFWGYEGKTSLPGALHEEFREVMRNLMTFLGTIHNNPSYLHKQPKHSNYDGFLCKQTPFTVHPVKKSPNEIDNACWTHCDFRNSPPPKKKRLAMPKLTWALHKNIYFEANHAREFKGSKTHETQLLWPKQARLGHPFLTPRALKTVTSLNKESRLLHFPFP